MRLAPLVCMGLVGASSVAWADAYRLRADVLGSAPSAAGLVVLTGEARPSTWVRAEAVVWTGSGEEHGDALIALVRLRHPDQRGDLTLGRFVLTTGAVRPIHLDGGWLRAKLPAGLGLEVFGGMPVIPVSSWGNDQQMAGAQDVGLSAYDWTYGARLSETVGALAGGGLSYVELRDFGRLADREVGADLWLSPGSRIDIAARLSYDVEQDGLSEAQVSAATRLSSVRLEAFATRRSPSRLLPATSIFSALGDVPSDAAGVTATWFAAPRLDVLATIAARSSDGDLGADGTVRATLRLDDLGDSALSCEATRFDLPDAQWSGLRFRARAPLAYGLSVSTEGELVFPDEPQGRGTVWPWGLVGLGGRFADRWQAALAIEAFASPERVREVKGIARLAYQWEAP